VGKFLALGNFWETFLHWEICGEIVKNLVFLPSFLFFLFFSTLFFLRKISQLPKISQLVSRIPGYGTFSTRDPSIILIGNFSKTISCVSQKKLFVLIHVRSGFRQKLEKQHCAYEKSYFFEGHNSKAKR